MKAEYSNRAVADLRKVSADSRAMFGDALPWRSKLASGILSLIFRKTLKPHRA
jgi:hypothetical protein